MKQRQQVQKEIDKLRVSIQTLTRSANPLGKVMDYVQEDLDSMQKELQRWKQENKEHALELKRERRYCKLDVHSSHREKFVF
jgi:TRAF3-interacting protein 1